MSLQDGTQRFLKFGAAEGGLAWNKKDHIRRDQPMRFRMASSSLFMLRLRAA
jgi:hypothetical protein